MPSNSGTVKVTGFKMDDVEFNLTQGAKMTVDEICTKYSIDKSNAVFILNGTALPASSAGSTAVKPGDSVSVSRSAKGGN